MCPLVCYDLRVPVWSKNKATIENGNVMADYDVLLYVANWPKRRRTAWKQLLIARAIENVSYVVGLNRVGKDAHGLEHTGDSGVFDFLGNKILNVKPLVQSVSSITLTKNELQKFRNDFQVLAVADAFSIK
jgi:predicted amidohydrolase